MYETQITTQETLMKEKISPGRLQKLPIFTFHIIRLVKLSCFSEKTERIDVPTCS